MKGAATMSTYTVGNYLATRFEQIGLKHYFMVPGDYNLVLLDQLLWNKHVQQIGCCNELNAAYAAEGYARVNGAGAVIVTFNVGAFSALNGVAGAYAESLPVIFVSAGYNTNDPSANHLLHHTIGTHDFSYQYEMIRRVTCAAVRILHAEDAPYLMDHAIRTALRERKPAYIEIACNLSTAPCAEADHPKNCMPFIMPSRSKKKGSLRIPAKKRYAPASANDLCKTC
jgi:pyruvate decarboxylase